MRRRDNLKKFIGFIIVVSLIVGVVFAVEKTQRVYINGDEADPDVGKIEYNYIV